MKSAATAPYVIATVADAQQAEEVQRAAWPTDGSYRFKSLPASSAYLTPSCAAITTTNILRLDVQQLGSLIKQKTCQAVHFAAMPDSRVPNSSAMLYNFIDRMWKSRVVRLREVRAVTQARV